MSYQKSVVADGPRKETNLDMVNRGLGQNQKDWYVNRGKKKVIDLTLS